MTVYEAIAGRQSVRSFTEKKIPKEVLERILIAGTQAPTARNDQLHYTIAVTDPAVIGRIMPHQPHVGTAPCVLVLCYRGERTVMSCGQSPRELDCAICLSFMVLAAMEEGLQGCWLGGFDHEQARTAIGLPEDVTIVAMHTLGYPDGETPRRVKKDPASLYEIR